MGVLHCTHKIHCGQEHEYEGLDKAYQDPQKHDRQGCKVEACQPKQDCKDHLLAKYITEQSNAKRHDPGEMTD